MATDDRPRRPRERRYVIVSKETVRQHAESVGIADLSDEVLEALAEDVSYRVRELIQQSYELMHHAKRRKLTTVDFNNALQNADVQPVFGHGAKEPVTYQETSNSELFYVEDTEVDVVAMATAEENVPQLASPAVNAEWLAVEGVSWSVAAGQQSFAAQGKSSVGRGIQSVSEDHLTYYEVVTKAILGSDSSVMKCALNDVQTSSKISPLLAYFINFVSNGVKTVSHDTSQLRRLLYTVKALVTNPFLYLQPKPYLSLLCETITYCLLEPLAASIHPSSDHWILRDYAAYLLAITMRRCNSELNKLEEDTRKQLADVLSDASRPWCSVYGAVVGLLAFGLNAVRETLLPALPGIMQRLLSALSDTNCVSRTDAQHVSSALLMCAEYLLHSARSTVITDKRSRLPTASHGVSQASSEVMQPDLYAMLYEFHSDALSARLPAMYDSFSATPSAARQSEMSLTGIDAAAGQSGEQLLQQFIEPAPRRTDSDRGSVILMRSERSSSVSSECADLGDMSVKETVSDPSRGIRLTILKKKPKLHTEIDPTSLQASSTDLKTAMQQPSVPASTAPAQTKVKELKKSPTKGISTQKVKVGLSEVFQDLVTFKRKQDIMFVFKFQGREQRCLPLLPRWGIGGRSTVSWYQVLCRRLPRVAPRMQKNQLSSLTEHLQYTRTVGLCALDLAQAMI